MHEQDPLWHTAVNRGWITARHAIISLRLFSFPLTRVQRRACAENTAKKKMLPSGIISASTAQCTWQKHPLNIGVYGPRRGRVRELSLLVIWPFIPLALFIRLPRFLSPFSLSFSLVSPRLLVSSLSRLTAYAYSRSPEPAWFFHSTISLVSLSSFSRQLAPWPIFRSS